MAIQLSAFAGAAQRLHPCPQAQLEAAVRALGTQTGEVASLVGLDRSVGSVVQIGWQRVPLLWLQVLTPF